MQIITAADGQLTLELPYNPGISGADPEGVHSRWHSHHYDGYGVWVFHYRRVTATRILPYLGPTYCKRLRDGLARKPGTTHCYR